MRRRPRTASETSGVRLESWLSLFATTTLFVMVVVFIWCLAVIPILNLFAMDFSPDYRSAAGALAFSAACFGAAVIITAFRRRASSRPGFMVWLLLIMTVLGLLVAWEAYRPSCPRGWWC